MSTNFPTSLDTYSDVADNVDDVMAADINNPQDAIEALEAKVGINNSVAATSHDYKIDALEGHAGIAKAWVYMAADGSTVTSLNVASTARTATGKYTIAWDTDFAGATYVVSGSVVGSGVSLAGFDVRTQAAGGLTIEVRQGGSLADRITMVIADGAQ